MSTAIPTPLRAAAGLAAATIDEARRLPGQLVALPVMAVSSALQVSLKAQQRYADLVIRGDALLSQLQPEPTDPPAWARFDEDEVTVGRFPADDTLSDDEPFLVTDDFSAPPTGPAGAAPFDDAAPVEDAAAEAESAAEGEPLSAAAEGEPLSAAAEGEPLSAAAEGEPLSAAAEGEPLFLPGYDDLRIAQLRARLRRLSAEQVEELLDYERRHQARPAYLTMLGNRLDTIRHG